VISLYSKGMSNTDIEDFMAEDRKEDTRSDTELMEEEKYHQKKEKESPHADHEARWFKNRCVTW